MNKRLFIASLMMSLYSTTLYSAFLPNNLNPEFLKSIKNLGNTHIEKMVGVAGVSGGKVFKIDSRNKHQKIKRSFVLKISNTMVGLARNELQAQLL